MNTTTHPHGALTSIMRHFALILGLLLLASAAHAQTSVPLLVNYQGTVTDSIGLPLGASGTPSAPVAAPVNRKIIFRLWDSATAGNRLWTEEQTVTISLGQFSVLLGQGINATGTAAGESRPALDTVFTGTGTDRFLGITVDNGDNSITNADTEITPRQRITSVAYSLRARTADSVASTTDLMLGGSANYGLGWYGTGKLFNGLNVNGPVLYGQGGGVLGAVNGATQTPVLRWNELGQVGIGTTAMPSGSELTLQGDDTNTPPLHLNIRGNTETNKRLLIGYNTTGNYGAIQAYNGTSGTPTTTTALLLNQAGGNVGVGNASPTSRLDVTGGIKATGAGGYTFNTGDLDGGLFSPADGAVTILTNNTERLRVDGSGNVGIGTTNPVYRLQVAGGNAVVSGAAAADSLGWVGVTNAGVERFSLGFAGTVGTWSSDAAVGDAILRGSNGKLLLQSGSGASAICINTSNNVGIGTTIPAQKLDVIGGTQSQWLELRVNNGTPYIDFSGTTAADFHARIIYAGTGDNRLHFEAAAFTYGPGNVGVGTTAPGAKLHVKAASDNAVGAGIKLEHAGDTNGWFIWPENANDNLLFMFNNQYPSGVYSLLSKNSSGFITVSDARIKKDIEVISGSLERVMKLRPKTYRFKSAAADTPLNYGFIAQEVELVYPDLIGESQGQKTLASNSLIAINTQAIQELKREKDSEVKALKDENEALKARVEALEATAKAREEADKAIATKLMALERLVKEAAKAEVQPVSLKKAVGGGAE